MVVATVDLDEVVSWRGKNSSQREQASAAPRSASLLALCEDALFRKRRLGGGLSGDCCVLAEEFQGGACASSGSHVTQVRAVQALAACSIPRVDVDFGLCLPGDTAALPSPAREPFYYRPEEEIAYGPAAWLWDYLRRR